jgi:hypothetical protein
MALKRMGFQDRLVSHGSRLKVYQATAIFAFLPRINPAVNS